MYRPKRIGMLLAAGAATVLVLAGCTGPTSDTNTTNTGVKTSTEKIAVITHGGAGDAFWDVVKKGAEQAGKDLGITVTYQGDGDAAGRPTSSTPRWPTR